MACRPCESRRSWERGRQGPGCVPRHVAGLAWEPAGGRVGGLPEASWRSWDGVQPSETPPPTRLCYGPRLGRLGGHEQPEAPGSAQPKEPMLPQSPPFKQMENPLRGEERGWEADRIGIQAPGSALGTDVPGCPGSSEADAMASVPPGQPGSRPPVPVPGLAIESHRASPADPLHLGLGVRGHTKGPHRAPGPPVLGSEGLDLWRSRCGQQPHLLPRVSSPLPTLQQRQLAPGGVGALCPTAGEVVQTCVGQSQSQGPSQQPLARPVTWAQLFRGKRQGLWRASVGTAVRKGKCVGWAGHRGPGGGSEAGRW